MPCYVDDPVKIILNPTAGRGKAGQLWATVQRLLQDAGLDFEMAMTRGGGHAVELARSARAAGHHRVVAMGGDGTVQEVVQGLVDAAGDDVAGTLGIIPAGSGNDFAKMIDLPPDPVIAVQRLASGNIRHVDVGRTGSRIFTNGIGIGFDARVAVESRKIRRLTGLPLYLLAVLRTLALSYNTPAVHMTLDDQTISQEVTMIAIANGRCYGGGFWIAPQADAADGLLDVVWADGLGRIGILQLLPHVVRGTHLDKKPVHQYRARRVIVEADDPLPVHADGEIWPPATHIDVELLPGRLHVIG